MKKFFLLLFIATSIYYNTYAYAINEIKFAIIDPIEIYTQTPQGEKSMNELHLSFKSNIEELNTKQQKLINKINEFKEEYHLLSQEEIEKKKQLLQISEENFKQQVSDFRNFEIYHEQRLASIFQNNLLEATKCIADKNSYNVVLNTNTLIYVSPKLNIDITAQIIKHMEKMFEN